MRAAYPISPPGEPSESRIVAWASVLHEPRATRTRRPQTDRPPMSGHALRPTEALPLHYSYRASAGARHHLRDLDGHVGVLLIEPQWEAAQRLLGLVLLDEPSRHDLPVGDVLLRRLS